MEITILKYIVMGAAGSAGAIGLLRHLCQVWITKIQCDKEQKLLKMAQDHEERMFQLRSHPQGKKAPPNRCDSIKRKEQEVTYKKDIGTFERKGKWRAD